MRIMQSILDFWNSLTVRVRLILVFITIKVLPLILLVWIAWAQTQETAAYLGQQFEELVTTANRAIFQVGDKAVSDAASALDVRARDEIERLTTDTARRVADFLHGRDADIRYAASLPPDADAYRGYVERKRQNLIVHGRWTLNADGSDWQPETVPAVDGYVATPGSPDNAISFHYLPPTPLKQEYRPLYLEMSFVGLDGMEKIKATTSPRVSPELKDVSERKNTYAKAETYFAALKKLKPGEIYVSDVIGRYVGSQIIGKFTPEAAKKRGIAFEPEKHAYAGKENPVGKRFEGIVRWATPVTENGRIIGWVTLALNHDHLMSFTDHIVPTNERYRDINDAFDGNYAFIWDYKGRSIVHPRHHSIVGYDENGEPEIPWLEDTVYEDFLKSGLPWREFMKTAPTFVDQLQSRKPAKALTERGDVGLDCRWLNFAPQCTGWYNLADQGGSGSFQILWSGLYKLTTTAAIPYYTGQYSPEAAGNKRGFGIVTIGANVDDFHRAATETKERLNELIALSNEDMHARGVAAENALRDNMRATALSLAKSTFVLIVLVIVIAIWMASYLSRKLGWLNDGFNRFRVGEKDFRFSFEHKDEITQLASTFNEMADTLNANMAELQREIGVRRKTEQELRNIHATLEQRIAERTAELSQEVETRRQAEVQLQYMAHHDPLTGLANRGLFNEQLHRALSQSKRSGKYGALLFFDLDKFKHVNDVLGHAVGDALLIHMANILKERVRGTDTAARLGGDEFAVVMVDMDRPERAAVLAQNILDKLETPVTLCGHELKVFSSIGIVTFPDRKNHASDDMENIIKNADAAMYLAKSSGGMRYRFFERGLHDKIIETDRLIGELHTALAENQFEPYFQPMFHTDAQQVLYLEVLARWSHPEHHILSPEVFLEPAAQSGLLTKIDMQMLDQACAYAKSWRDAALLFGRVSINISQAQLEHAGFADEVERSLKKYELPPFCLAVEISEYVLIKNSSQSTRALKYLRDMGVQIIIDKLQAEPSALTNLLEYPVDAIKIGTALTARIGDVRVDTMISTIASVANAVHLRVIAEGVETEEQWRYFESLHCETIQGFRHAVPMNAADTRRYLEEHQPPASSPTAPAGKEG
ncbi:MAG: EAL domain-containing protein [Candidatus Accumulibacter sp.]|jgi:diguanylate cyclase (GGDEF)-like protein|nr:EAL domain-containing protein [Accumulibacter sp.]